jgi:dipeptidase E
MNTGGQLKIVALGGGSFNRRQTWRIDREIVSMAGVERPHVLFIPTAMDDAPEHIDAFQKLYGKKLGCEVQVLKLVRNPMSVAQIEAFIDNSDLIYAGPGNTQHMLDIWRQKGIDVLLRRAAEKGGVMCGMSAGAICWFDKGHSDSARYDGGAKWSYGPVSGLGLIDAIFCPHYHTQKREQDLAKMVVETTQVAIACDDDAAFSVEDDKYRVLPVSPKIKAYRIVPHKGEAVREPLPTDGQYRPLASAIGFHTGSDLHSSQIKGHVFNGTSSV